MWTLPQTYDLLPFPAATLHPDAKGFTAAKAAWNKKNTQAFGVLQGTTLPVIWQDFIAYNEASTLWTEFKNCSRKAGGAMTYLQLANIVKI